MTAEIIDAHVSRIQEIKRSSRAQLSKERADLAESLRAIRETKGYTVAELATRAGVSNQYIYNAERGRTSTSPAIIAIYKSLPNK